jgi:hypothetical protein
MFRYLQIFWYYPSFFFFLYIYVIKVQEVSKLTIRDRLFSVLVRTGKSFLDRFNFE